MILTRSFEWSPESTPPPHMPPGSVTVPTNGRGALMWLLPNGSGPGQLPDTKRHKVAAGGGFALSMRQPKVEMDPLDSTTWQRPYRFSG